MPHDIDGFQLRFTGRNTWKAERREQGELLDVIPVAWTKDTDTERSTQAIWYRKNNLREMEERLAVREPFVVAVAEAKDYRVIPHSFKKFSGVYEMVATGVRLGKQGIQARILRRLGARRLRRS